MLCGPMVDLSDGYFRRANMADGEGEGLGKSDTQAGQRLGRGGGLLRVASLLYEPAF